MEYRNKRMAESKGEAKSAAEPDLENIAMTQTHNALTAMLEAISGLNGKIDVMAVEQAKQKNEIESIKNTPHRLPPPPLPPLGPTIRDDDDEDYSDMPNLESDAAPSRRSTGRRDSFIASNTLADEVRRMPTAGVSRPDRPDANSGKSPQSQPTPPILATHPTLPSLPTNLADLQSIPTNPPIANPLLCMSGK